MARGDGYAIDAWGRRARQGVRSREETEYAQRVTANKRRQSAKAYAERQQAERRELRLLATLPPGMTLEALAIEEKQFALMRRVARLAAGMKR